MHFVRLVAVTSASVMVGGKTSYSASPKHKANANLGSYDAVKKTQKISARLPTILEMRTIKAEVRHFNWFKTQKRLKRTHFD